VTRTFAVIDTGTNSVKLLIASFSRDNKPIIIKEDITITRLGRGIGLGRNLLFSSIHKTARVVNKFYRQCLLLKAKTVIIGTSALRECRGNSRVLFESLLPKGVCFRILSKKNEAIYGFLGAVFNGAPKGNFIVVDIGGGTAQLSIANGTKVIDAVSLPLGAVRMTEKFAAKCACDSSYADMLHYITGVLKRHISIYRKIEQIIFIGGTAVTVGAILGRLSCKKTRLNVAGMRRILEDKPFAILTSELWSLLCQMNTMDIDKRVRCYGIERGRADILPAGIAVMHAICRFFGKDSATVRWEGVRHGILHEFTKGN
jgi:exopolyphosphatase/guanosine-5'-triphosphate,3'-diphosphate pyrophosphatase